MLARSWVAAALLLFGGGCREDEVAPGALSPEPPDPQTQVLAFEAPAGQEAIQSLQVVNPGKRAIFLQPVLAESPFSTDLTGLERLDPGEKRDILFRFRPAKAGEFHGQVAVRDSGGGAVLVVLEGKSTAPEVCKWEVEDAYEDVRPAVDVVVVVDDSAATEELHDRLQYNVGALPAFFAEVGVDYRLAVVAGSTKTGCTGGSFLGDPPVLEPDVADASTLLADRLSVATCTGQGDGLLSVQRALTSDAGEAFQRPDAGLMVIFVSARDDGSPEATAAYVATLVGQKSAGRASLVSAISVVGWAQPCVDVEAGTRYVEAATLLGGSSVDICDDNWKLPDLWQALPEYGIPTVYAVTQEPVDVDGDFRITESDLEVRIDDALVPSRDAEGNRIWDYDGDAQRIELYPGHVPAPGSTLRIRYARGCTER